jgi:hypothetical protein
LRPTFYPENHGKKVGRKGLCAANCGQREKSALVAPSLFLSRLCGGQQRIKKTEHPKTLLSRLCGGQQH